MPRYLVQAVFRIRARDSEQAENIVQNAVEATTECLSTNDVSAVCADCESEVCICYDDEDDPRVSDEY